MSGACSAYGGEVRLLQGFGGETWRKRTLGRPRRRWGDNIVSCGMDWIDLAKNTDNGEHFW